MSSGTYRNLAAVVAVCLAWPGMPAAGDLGCWGEDPLLRIQWESIPLEESPSVIGEWRLPVRADAPDLMTEARVQMQLLNAGRSGGWKVLLHFSFPDPKPYGIPFSFQKAELVWETESGPFRTALDWSSNCTGPGRGLYPKQSWSAVADLPSFARGSELRLPVLRIWGSRN